MPEPKGPGGRPSVYDPAFCDMVVEHMAEGRSLTSFAGKISVEPRTVERWASETDDNSKPEFCRAVKIGRAKAVEWWESRAREAAAGESKGNPAVIIFGLKNRAKEEWSDKITLANDPERPLTDAGTDQTDRAKALAQVLLPMLAKAKGD